MDSGQELHVESDEFTENGSVTSASVSASNSSMTSRSSSGSSSEEELEDPMNSTIVSKDINDTEHSTKRKPDDEDNGSEELIYRDGFYIGKKNASTVTSGEGLLSNIINIDYKDLYKECQRQIGNKDKQLREENIKYNDIILKYQNIETSNTTEFEKMTDAYEDKIKTLKAEHEAKDSEDRMRNEVQRKIIIKKSDEKMFRFKERGKGSTKNLTTNNCDNPECTSVNVHLMPRIERFGNIGVKFSSTLASSHPCSCRASL